MLAVISAAKMPGSLVESTKYICVCVGGGGNGRCKPLRPFWLTQSKHVLAMQVSKGMLTGIFFRESSETSWTSQTRTSIIGTPGAQNYANPRKYLWYYVYTLQYLFVSFFSHIENRNYTPNYNVYKAIQMAYQILDMLKGSQCIGQRIRRRPLIPWLV